MSGPWTEADGAEGPQLAETFDRSLRRVLDNIRDYAIFMMDGERCVVGWNAGAERILGYSAREILHRTADIIFTPEDRASGQPALEQAQAAREGRAEDERWHMRKDGTRFYASGVLSPVVNADGETVGFVKVLQDYTERRVAAEALARSEERYRLLVESVNDYAIFMLDSSGHVQSWTPAAERLLGYREPEVLGQPFSIFFTEADRAEGVPGREIATALRDGRVDAVGWRVRKDGTVFWGEEIATAVRDESGRVQGVSKIVRDITERMVAEEERERLLRQMTEANRIKDEFLGTVSHELRTPLNSILGWTRLLRDGHLDPQSSRRALETIERNALAQTRLVEDLLDVSRIITGQLRLHLQSVDIPAVLTAALDALRPAADAKEITLEVDVSPAAEELVADPERLQQIIWNLVANAIKFTPRHGTVRIEAVSDAEEVLISVIDTGAGIAPEFLPFVFDRFRQADSTSTRAQAGLGLGLAIVRHLTEVHGGQASAESAGVGHGATFRVRLPRHLTGTWDTPHAPASSSVVTPTREAAPDLHGVRVLVVEDDPDARAFMETTLRGRGAVVEAAASAMEGWTAAARVAPDIVVADIAMPMYDGYRLIHEIRSSSDPRVKGIPAIAVTAYARAVDRERARSAGYQDHLAKPVDPYHLIVAVHALVSRNRS